MNVRYYSIGTVHTRTAVSIEAVRPGIVSIIVGVIKVYIPA